MPESTPALLRARWYDGRSSQPQPVLVGLEPGARGPGLRLHPLTPGTAVPPPLAHDEVEWPEAWRPSRAQRADYFRPRCHCRAVARWQPDNALAMNGHFAVSLDQNHFAQNRRTVSRKAYRLVA